MKRYSTLPIALELEPHSQMPFSVIAKTPHFFGGGCRGYPSAEKQCISTPTEKLQKATHFLKNMHEMGPTSEIFILYFLDLIIHHRHPQYGFFWISLTIRPYRPSQLTSSLGGIQGKRPCENVAIISPAVLRISCSPYLDGLQDGR